jgi:hypothetical protein
MVAATAKARETNNEKAVDSPLEINGVFVVAGVGFEPTTFRL